MEGEPFVQRDPGRLLGAMGLRTTLLAYLLLPVAAGCRTADIPAVPGTAPARGGLAAVCPNPECAAAAARTEDARLSSADAKRSAEKQDRAAVVVIRESPSLSLETEGDRPIRGRMVYGDQSTFVEVSAVEVASPSVDHPGLVRFAMRLCSEDGTTRARDLRPSRRPGRRYDALPEGWTSDAEGGVPFQRYYSCEGGTAWEVNGIADVLDGRRVRFTLRGRWISCTK